MDRLTVTLKTVTPMFLGGAEPDKIAELRAPSIKGALRFWYRAIDPEYNKPFDLSDPKSPTWEEKIFGSTEHGQGYFSMKLENGFLKGDHDWVPGNNQGLRYLSFSLSMGGNRRKCIPPNTDICITLTFRHNPDDKEKKAILASLWVLGHVGGLGSRSRRGLGTVALQSWNCRWNECEELKIAHNAKSVDDWWYFAPENGQHVSFYTKKALLVIAKSLNCRLYSNNKNLHLLTKRNFLINPVWIISWANTVINKLFGRHFNRRNSLIESDNKYIKDKTLINMSN